MRKFLFFLWLSLSFVSLWGAEAKIDHVKVQGKGADTIYLLSCNVGNGDFAQELADALGEGARVQAPDGYIWFDKDGKAYLGDMDENGNYKPNPDKKFKGSVGKGSSGQGSAGE